MRTLAKATLGLSFIGAMAIGPTVPVQAQGFYLDAPGVHIGVGDPYYHRRSYNYSGGWRTWNGCPPDWTIQGGVCRPYRHGPWDYGYGWVSLNILNSHFGPGAVLQSRPFIFVRAQAAWWQSNGCPACS